MQQVQKSLRLLKEICWKPLILPSMVTLRLSVHIHYLRVHFCPFTILVFDKGYIDCNFMLTGQQIAIVTAGVGVFEVIQYIIVWLMYHVVIM